MTEQSLPSPRISVKARAREINSRTAAQRAAAPPCTLRRVPESPPAVSIPDDVCYRVSYTLQLHPPGDASEGKSGDANLEAAAVPCEGPKRTSIFSAPEEVVGPPPDDASSLDELIDTLEKICDEFDLTWEDSWSTESPSDPCAQRCDDDDDNEEQRNLVYLAVSKHGCSEQAVRHDEPLLTMDSRLAPYRQTPKVALVPNLCVKTLTRVPARPTPTHSRSPVRTKPELPAYVTLGGRRSHGSCEEVYRNHDLEEIAKIRTILAGLDFTKYRRGSTNKHARSISTTCSPAIQPRPELNRSFSAMDRFSLVPKSPLGRSNRLRDLTEKLKPSTAPTSPNLRFPKPLVSRSSSFCNSPDMNSPIVRATATLPRRKVTVPATPSSIDHLDLEPLPQRNCSDLSLDSAIDSTVDEGLVADDESSWLQSPRSPVPVPERRKRRKGVTPSVGFQIGAPEYSKSSSGRSLTYPPQRRSSVSEEELDFATSVDSNRLRSLNRPCRHNELNSDLSLTDSHLEGGPADETYGDVVEEVISGGTLNVDDRKCLKKKHHSDPGGDTGDALELIAASKSEPELGDCSDSSKEDTKTPSSPQPLGGKSPQQHRRYSKRRLRGPYGEMLEEEMRKSGEKQKPSVVSEEICMTPGCEDGPRVVRPALLPSSLSLDDSDLKRSNSSSSEASVPRRKISANIPFVGSDTLSPPAVFAVTASEPNLLQEEYPRAPWRKSANEKEKEKAKKHPDTRTHVVGELYDTEKSYVESLQILVNKYMKLLKSSEYSGLVDSCLIDEIFYQIPEILGHHESFLEVLRQRLSNWDNKQKVGDVFVESFAKQPIIDTYTSFINNWKSAKEAIKLACQAKPSFAKFLEHMSREHKGKLTLDALLIMPVQRIPRYELLIKELLKHTHVDHPDHQPLVLAQKEVHDLAVKINRVEREAYQHEQMQQRVREIEHLIEGVMDLIQPDRIFIRYDIVAIPGGLGTKKERCMFLFSDLLLITSIKRRSGTIRKTSSSSNSPSPFGSLEMNKYKLLMRFSLDNLDIAKNGDLGVKRILKDIEALEEDVSVLGQINDLASNLSCHHQVLDEVVRDLMGVLNKQLTDKQNTDIQLLNMELTVTTQEGIDNLVIIFSSAEKRASWEAAFNEAKQKLALSTDRRPPPEFMYPLPIRKTRAGLQFTCAASTLGLNSHGLKDVWVCNSDGYVGQVCVLSLQPDPTVASCNGVCNARILSVASIPALQHLSARRKSLLPDNAASVSIHIEDTEEEEQHPSNGNFQLDSDSSEDDDESVESPDEETQKGNNLSKEDSREEMDNMQPTMWLGTEDGCIHIYNCNDNIRIKKNKFKIQHSACVQCIIYLDSRVFVSLANGDLVIYRRDSDGSWITLDPQRVQVGTTACPVLRMLAVAGKLWCGCQNSIAVVNTNTLDIEERFQVSSDTSRAVLCMVTSGLGVWIALQHSAVVRLFHATTYECLLDVSVAPAVTKMLSSCDDIIRQHKAACLRVTAMLTCKDLLWVGTSAGVLLTMPLPHLTSTTTRLDNMPNVAGVPHGHTGHVRFLTAVEMSPNTSGGCSKYSHRSIRNKEGLAARRASTTAATGCRLLVISGGDGYEDFRNTSLSEAAGRDDSTNHLLLWQV